jgi:hypothetical protein
MNFLELSGSTKKQCLDYRDAGTPVNGCKGIFDFARGAGLREVCALSQNDCSACNGSYPAWGDHPNMFLQPVVRCKNSDCPSPSAIRIRLPYVNPPASSEAAPNWPAEGWKTHLICTACDHWYIYGKDDVQWAPYTRPLSEETRVDFVCAELECGEPGCGIKTKWHVLDPNQMSESETIEFVLRADPVAVCENDHPYSISGVKSSSVKKADSV